MGATSKIEWTEATCPCYTPGMAQTHDGAIKVAAERVGCSVEERERRTAAGEKWCVACRAWHERAAFGADASRYDGLASGCRTGRNSTARIRYMPKARSAPGRNFVPPRAGDRKQARRRVNFFVETGLLPSPNALPCSDCGHEWRPGGRRHEYDHHLGYAAENHERVEVVCSRCHHERERVKRGKRNDD